MRRRLVTLGCWGLGVLLLSAVGIAQLPEHPQIESRGVAAWVDELAVDVESQRPEDGDLDVTYLLVDQQIQVPPRGPATVYKHFAYRIESRSALEEWSSWDIEIDPSYHRLAMHHLKIYRQGAWQDRLSSSRSSLLHREDDLDRQLFDQRLNLVLIFDDVRPGDVISIAYSLVGENPVFGGRFTTSESLAWGRTLQRRRLRVVHATQRPLHYKVFGPGTEPRDEESGGWRSLVWDDGPVPEIEYEDGATVDFVQFPFVQLSEFADWRQVVSWAQPLYERSLDHPPAALRQLAARLMAEHGQPEERLVAARDWVQENIRYFGVMLGEHSHAPHDSAEILRRHYGDCKDKAILLVELLRLMDIEAFPAFVNTRLGDAVADRLPSPTVFDHAIVLVELDDRQVWIDPTLSFQGGNLQDGELCIPDYGLALPVRPDAEGLQAIAPQQVDGGRTEVVYTYDLARDGDPWKVRIETTFERHTAERMRDLFDSTTPEDLLEGYVEHYGSDVFEIESLAPLGVVDHRHANLLSVSEQYRVTYQPVDDDDSTVLSTLPLLIEGDLAMPDLDTPRRGPFALAEFPARSERIVLRLPNDYSLAPVELEEDNPWFRFSIASRMLSAEEAGPGQVGLELSYELERRADQVAVEDLETYGAAVQRVWDNLGYMVWQEGLMGSKLRRFAQLSWLTAGLAVLFLAIACLAALARWRLI